MWMDFVQLQFFAFCAVLFVKHIICSTFLILKTKKGILDGYCNEFI